ncbi:hypothetical protein HETIRDRAFT_453011 [Heterobasidion irregulare TC 32-1]|uniref:Uncharacterized protein n=1 Tax=Heterobasidion irregulare (strain TC 32-1) TaxID=747525 RepID=W4K2G8_HETIT|nr:uncharacterized protein HETIRDRAFT_453011 [Heterobasidion irregulare TC 32-1]ETW80002.1 hypothetical protein HETIRDRAFT_453011 [Heterobasidion irregulare TC 32-1]
MLDRPQASVRGAGIDERARHESAALCVEKGSWLILVLTCAYLVLCIVSLGPHRAADTLAILYDLAVLNNRSATSRICALHEMVSAHLSRGRLTRQMCKLDGMVTARSHPPILLQPFAQRTPSIRLFHSQFIDRMLIRRRSPLRARAGMSFHGAVLNPCWNEPRHRPAPRSKSSSLSNLSARAPYPPRLSAPSLRRTRPHCGARTEPLMPRRRARRALSLARCRPSPVIRHPPNLASVSDSPRGQARRRPKRTRHGRSSHPFPQTRADSVGSIGDEKEGEGKGRERDRGGRAEAW